MTKMQDIRSFKFDEKIFVAIILVLALITRVRYAGIAMERDEGEYAYAGWQILRGALPYQDFYNMKFPGVYYLYALVFSIFGHSMVAIRLVVMALNLGSAFFVGQLARGYMSERGAWVSAGCFLLLSLSCQAQGFTSNCEHFVVFFALLGLFLLSKESIIAAFGAGIALGISLLMKQQGLIFFFFAGFLVLHRGYLSRAYGLTAKTLLALAAGFCLPIGMLFYWLNQNSLTDSFYQLCFEYAAAYANIASPFTHIKNFLTVFQDNPIFWLFCLFSIGILLKKMIFAPNNGRFSQSKAFLLLVFWALTFVALMPGWYFRPHYFHYFFPASALVVGFFYDQSALIKPFFGFNKWAFRRENVLAFGLLVSVSIQTGYFFVFSPDRLSHYIYRGAYFPSHGMIGKKIMEKATPNEKMLIFGNEPQVLFYAQLASATPFLYRYPLVEQHRFAATFTDTHLNMVGKNAPEWLVWIEHDDWYENEETHAQLKTWFNDFKQNYTFIEGIYPDSTTFSNQIDTSQRAIGLVFRKK